jgi:DNA-binding CsgD family transcriptional regulator
MTRRFDEDRPTGSAEQFALLTPRERRLLRYLRGGEEYAGIAAHLGATEAEVHAEVADITSKLGLQSDAELAAWARESSDLARIAREDAPSRFLDWMPEAGALAGPRRTSAATIVAGLVVIGLLMIVILSLIAAR